MGARAPSPVKAWARRLGIWCVLAIGLTGFARTAEAGAWTLDAGTGALIVTGTTMQASSVFDSGSKLRPIPRYSKDEAQALIEYGVTDWLTAAEKL